MMIKKLICMALAGVCVLSALPSTAAVAETTAIANETTITQFMDCFMPMPIVEELSEDCWGAAEVGARDQGNGLEDRDLSDYCYWDGSIIRDEETGSYYMFASRWNQAGGHWGENGIAGWQGSQAIYAVSDNLYGPYEDQGPIWPDWCDGAGHNVFAFQLSEDDPLYGTYKYGISISDTGMHGEIANGTIHVSNSLEGPWTLLGKMQVNGGDFYLSNISILVRPDGKYETINRNGDIAIADTIAGPWTLAESKLWWKVPGMSSENVEDPVIWYSDGLYHCVVNKWDARSAYYLTSEDGITNWKLRPGTAYTPDADYLEYEDGTVNNWTKIERPNVYIEDGTLKAMTFAVIDVQKEADFGNDQHGSKVIVVPFSGEDLAGFATQESPLDSRSGILPVEDSNIQSWGEENNKNYGAEPYIQVQRDVNWQSHGMGILGEGVRPDEWYDNKVGYLKYDISEYDLANTEEEIENAYLSLVYLHQAAGTATADKIQVALADSDWKEGTGREIVNGNVADTGVLTWENQASLSGNDSVISDEFSTHDSNIEIKIDVTELVKKFREVSPEEDYICFAFNETSTGNRLRFGSLNAGDTYAPKLAIHYKKPVVVEPEMPYVDVKENDWFYNQVYYNYLEGTMTGKDKTHFAPTETLVRAQFAEVLYKMNEKPEVAYTGKFSDVTDGDWFANSVLWAADKKIVTGYTDTTLFGPNDNVTREQMATMIYRYAKDYKGYKISANGDYSTFPDADGVQEFAKDAMKWAVENEIITGKTIDGVLVLDPQGSANRAECATIIQRFMEKYEKAAEK